ncbi:MutR family transcriptional regulator [Streptococcus sp. HMSC34B10]|uniref:Rgg/GadR/MutR family transcriptional regulator n=1 Tax=Streptococcus sp. HMSC34B10 TaxID=1608856 RepID=UPI0008AA1ABD|nr:Rgg/GadR/MutR family transcriptional regulator [Streptococcus sp. HMSC34B10]OHS88096.1 MutR family transcriptional regulator [Streptococcus sp. HMSC34B10]
MKNLGKVFKELRESRKISLRKATGGGFSASLLSRFENGKSEISAQKLFVALENIHANVEELLFLARGFHQDAYSEFRNRIFEAIDPQDLTSLRTLYQREYQQLPFSKERQQHILNAILIKSYMKAIDETVTLTSEEERVLHDYLFSVEIWGLYELLFFSSCSSLLSVQLLTKYTREMLRKSDFLQGVGKNRNIMHTLLLNAFMVCIEVDDFTNALYFKKQIEKNFFEENETYFRIVYLWAEGLLDSKQGRAEEGQRKMEDAVRIFEMIGCSKSADYYRNS